MKKLVLAICALCAQPVFARAEAPSVEQRVTPIIARFEARLRACGVTPAYEPKVVVDSAPTLISFDTSDRAIHISQWDKMPAPIQGMITQWAAQGTLGLSPADHFAEIFNSLLVPHELGHFVAMMDGRYEKSGFWDNEVFANPEAYGWYQGLFMREAWARRDEANFCALVKPAPEKNT